MNILDYVLATTLWTIALWIANRLWQHFQEKNARIKHGCSAAKTLPGSRRVLGITKLRESAARIKDGSYLELCRHRFSCAGTNTFASTALGKTALDTCDPENVRTILATNFKDWALGEDRRSAFSPLLGNGIFAADGHDWRISRTVLRPSFTSRHLDRFEVFEDRFQSMLTAIHKRNGATDLSEAFGCFTLDCTTEIFFGKSYNSTETLYECDSQATATGVSDLPITHFVEAFGRCQRTMADNLVLGRLGPYLMGAKGRRMFDQDRQTVLSFVREAVNHALASREAQVYKAAKTTFLQSLLANDQTPSDVESALVNILVAGRDTTASLLSNLWFMLARRPQIYRKLRAEIQRILGSDPTSVPTADHLHGMSYLQACIHEALRLYPPVPLNSRTAVRDTVLPTGGGKSGQEPIFIPQGTRVGYNVYTMHRREDLWGQTAHQFDPERWIGDDGSMRKPGWEYLPFNAGPRVCIGQKLALLQASFITCRLAQHFRGIQAEADNMTQDPCAATVKGTGLHELTKEAPASSWQWRESLTLTCSSAAGTHVTLRS